MSRFIELSDGMVINTGHIIRTAYRPYEYGNGREFVIYLSTGYEIAVSDNNTVQSIIKLLTNNQPQSTIKINQDSNQPEKGKQ